MIFLLHYERLELIFRSYAQESSLKFLFSLLSKENMDGMKNKIIATTGHSVCHPPFIPNEIYTHTHKTENVKVRKMRCIVISIMF